MSTFKHLNTGISTGAGCLMSHGVRRDEASVVEGVEVCLGING